MTLSNGTVVLTGSIAGAQLATGRRAVLTTSSGVVEVEIVGIAVVDPNLVKPDMQMVLGEVLRGEYPWLKDETLHFDWFLHEHLSLATSDGLLAGYTRREMLEQVSKREQGGAAAFGNDFSNWFLLCGARAREFIDGESRWVRQKRASHRLPSIVPPGRGEVTSARAFKQIMSNRLGRPSPHPPKIVPTPFECPVFRCSVAGYGYTGGVSKARCQFIKLGA
jgi:hypothetical protein